jgi:hypothetical protein
VSWQELSWITFQIKKTENLNHGGKQLLNGLVECVEKRIFARHQGSETTIQRTHTKPTAWISLNQEKTGVKNDLATEM